MSLRGRTSRSIGTRGWWRVLISALIIVFFTMLVGVLFWLAERPVKR
jgi:hypothetical protein